MIPLPARVKIVSGGTFYNSRVEIDGEPLAGVQSVTWTMDAKDHPCGSTTIVLDLAAVELDVIDSLDTPVIRDAAATETSAP